MQKNSLHDFVWFGGSYQYLRLYSREDSPYWGAAFLEYNLGRFFSFLNRNQMNVSLNASRQLKSFKEDLDSRYTEEENLLSYEDAEKLSELVGELRIVIFSEAQEISAFFPSPKRYNSEYLTDDIGKIFGESVFSTLPDNAKKDFEEAGKCILFETPTAAAYHLMRGAECVLKHLYLCCIKRNRLTEKRQMWGPMVEHLVDRKQLDEAQKATLDNFRKGFRNPVAHPNKFYSVDEAQDLLGTTTQLIALLASHKAYGNL